MATRANGIMGYTGPAKPVEAGADPDAANEHGQTALMVIARTANVDAATNTVAKTYRMLEEGHRRVARGTDLVVGFVESHGRPHTLELLEGLDIVPRRRIDYRGVVVEERDTDAVIARHPTVALIDELAHTTVPGSAFNSLRAFVGFGVVVTMACGLSPRRSPNAAWSHASG